MMIPTEEEYAQALIERHTRPVYEKLRSARVAIAGLGGLGVEMALASLHRRPGKHDRCKQLF